MNKSTKWFVAAALAASGVVGFACGGGNAESNPPNAGSASATATESAAPSATESAAPTASATQAPTPPPPLVVSAMKFMIPKQKMPVEVKDDGSVMVGKKMALKFVGADLQDASGKVLASVAADGTTKFDGLTKGTKFDDKDALVVEGGDKMFIADDGSVKLTDAAGKPDKDSGKMKFVGFKPAARRAATVLVMAFFMVGTAKTSSASSVPSSVPAKK